MLIIFNIQILDEIVLTTIIEILFIWIYYHKNADGITYLTTPDNARIRLDPNQNEGAMDLKIVADGFYDYEKKDAVMIIKTR